VFHLKRAGKKRSVIPLHEDPFFIFRLAEDRIISRFHLEGVAAGRPVRVYAADPKSLAPTRFLATALVGEGGWVDLLQPIIVRAGEVFVVFPEDQADETRPTP
jgi:hypothetical protein